MGHVCNRNNNQGKSYNEEFKSDFSKVENDNQNINKILTPKLNKGNKIFNIIKGFKREKSEEEKIEKKLKRTNKDLDNLNKQLMENYKLLDKKKYHVEKINKERNNYKNELANLLEQ